MTERRTMEALRDGRATAALKRYAGQPCRIWSGEHRAWWRPASAGYTTELKAAGIYVFEDALANTRRCGPEKKIIIERICPRDPPANPEFVRGQATALAAIYDHWACGLAVKNTMDSLGITPLGAAQADTNPKAVALLRLARRQAAYTLKSRDVPW